MRDYDTAKKSPVQHYVAAANVHMVIHSKPSREMLPCKSSLKKNATNYVVITVGNSEENRFETARPDSYLESIYAIPAEQHGFRR